MYYLLLTTFLILLPTMAFGQTADMESRFLEIDKAIAESPRYVAQREAKITVARRAFDQASGRQKYNEGYRLYLLYRRQYAFLEKLIRRTAAIM